LLEFSAQEKKEFLIEILNLEPQEREQLIDEMLKKSQ
jgi:hypothetical protein